MNNAGKFCAIVLLSVPIAAMAQVGPRAVTYNAPTYMYNNGGLGGPTVMQSGHLSCHFKPASAQTQTVWQAIATNPATGQQVIVFEFQLIHAGATTLQPYLYFADLNLNAISFTAPPAGDLPVNGAWYEVAAVWSLTNGLQIANMSLDGSLLGMTERDIQGAVVPQPPINGDTWTDGADYNNGVVENYYSGNRSECVLHVNTSDDDWTFLANYANGNPSAIVGTNIFGIFKPVELGTACYGPYQAALQVGYQLGTPIICERANPPAQVASWKSNGGLGTPWSGGGGITASRGDDMFAPWTGTYVHP